MNSPTKCLIALMDIMGFSKYVNENSSESVQQYLSTFIEMTRRFNAERFNYNINIFSDTVIVSVPIDETEQNTSSGIDLRKFFLLINNLQMANIVFNGILPIRGGITIGEYFTDGKDLLFGKGLIEVYNTECKIACYPRIVVNKGLLAPEVSKEANDRLNSFFNQLGFGGQAGRENTVFDERTHPVKKDFDGLYYCNYLSALHLIGNGWAEGSYDALEKHKDFIVGNLSNSSEDATLTKKYGWMKTYHNWFCEGYDEFRDCLIGTAVTP